MTSIAVSSKNVPIRMKLSCIRIKVAHGLRLSLSVNTLSTALTAPRPSNTAPNANAASMIHINIQVMPRVLRTDFSNTVLVIRPLSTAAVNAAIAPIAELSTNEVQPFTNGIIIVAKMVMGSSPARRRRIFSACVILRSHSGKTGPRTGFIRHLTTI